MNEEICKVLSQEQEVSIETFSYKCFNGRYAYARAAETQKYGDKGQDFLTFQTNGDSLVFVLCDGVSQSFYGELAASSLGISLRNCLFEKLPVSMDVDEIFTCLHDHLHMITEEVSVQVNHYPLPEDMLPLLRSVLEEKRAKGSETTFICGRIDLPGPEFEQGRVILSWLGDSRLRIWSEDEEISELLGGSFQTKERWSSKLGPVGRKTNVFVTDLSGEKRLTRIAAYSDGLAALDDFCRVLKDDEVQALIKEAEESAGSDDISFLEISIYDERTDSSLSTMIPKQDRPATQVESLKGRWCIREEASSLKKIQTNEADHAGSHSLSSEQPEKSYIRVEATLEQETEDHCQNPRQNDKIAKCRRQNRRYLPKSLIKFIFKRR